MDEEQDFKRSDAERAQEKDYASKYLQTTPSPDDAKLDPELQALLKKLYDRQRDERSELIDNQIIELQQVEDYRRTDIVELHFDDAQVAKDQKREIDNQLDRFAEERERYITDYQKAQTIRDGMPQQSREQAQERGLDDMPKLSY